MIRSRQAGPRVAILVLAAGGWACGSPAPSSSPPPAPRSTAELSEPSPVPAGRPAATSGEYGPHLDATHYDVELVLSDSEPMLWGMARVDLDRRSAGSRPITLDLTGLAVSGTWLEGRLVEHTLRQGKLIVPVPSGLREVDRITLEIRYRGTPDDGLIMRNTLHGRSAVFADNWPNRARFWFPSVDHPSDKASVRFTVHAPSPWQVIGNGRLVGDPSLSAGGRLAELGFEGVADHRTWVWQSDVEMPSYTMVIGATQFERDVLGLAGCGSSPASPREDGCVEVGYWVFAEDTAFARSVFRRAPEMVDFFSQLVGPFPYEKLMNVQSATRFGGMENSSAIFYSEQAIATGSLSEGTVSHEIAHQWFGDGVTEADWSHLWLSEGFATYFGALFFEQMDGVDDFRQRLRDAADTYLASSDVGHPVIATTQDLFSLLNRNTYQKGGWVLHMLRGVVGDDAFFDGVRRYYARHRNATALTSDFRAAVEASSGQDLGWFFEQWLERPGYPEFSIDWDWHDADSSITLVIAQTQDPSWPSFRVPAEIELVTRAGPTRQSVLIEGRSTELSLPASERPTAIVLDPDGWVLKRIR